MELLGLKYTGWTEVDDMDHIGPKNLKLTKRIVMDQIGWTRLKWTEWIEVD